MPIPIVGKKIRTKAYDFESILYKMLESPTEASFQLIKTMKVTGFFTGENLISRLTVEETRTVRILDQRLAMQSEKYRAAQPLDLKDILPPRLGVRIKVAAYAGINQKTQKEQIALVILKGRSLAQIVEARMFLTLQNRHSKAAWFFATGKNFWQMPIVLVEDGGWFDGSLLAMISPVRLSTKRVPSKSEDLAFCSRTLIQDEVGFRYLLEE